MNTQSNTKSNFGSKGWLMIFFAGVMFYFFAAFVTDGLNVIVSNFSAQHGLDPAYILGLATPASWAGLLGAVVWAWFVDRFGTRVGMLVTGLLGGISYMLYGVVSTGMGFFVVTALANFMAQGFSATVAYNLMANWFPVKKGLALGWATMGQNLASATFVPLFLVLMRYFMLNGTFFAIGIIFIVLSLLGAFLIRNTPEELGCTPDNGSFTQEEIEANLKELREYQSPWTPKKLLTNKQIWLMSLVFGVYMLVTAGLVSQLIPRLTSCGWSEAKATGMMTVAAILGLFGSYATGWLDQKIGTKRATVVYGAWYLVALILCALPANDFTLYGSIFFTGIGIGGVGNLYPSLAATIFGRFDFVRAMGVLNPITAIIRSFAFIILSFGLTNLGGYSGAYAIIAVLDLIAILLATRVDDTCVGKQ